MRADAEILAEYDRDVAFAALRRVVGQQMDLLEVVPHAIAHGRFAVAEEYVERALDALRDALAGPGITVPERTGRGAENCGYVRGLLMVKEPRFAALLDLAVRMYGCEHPGVFSAHVPGDASRFNPTEHCWLCGADVPYQLL